RDRLRSRRRASGRPRRARARGRRDHGARQPLTSAHRTPDWPAPIRGEDGRCCPPRKESEMNDHAKLLELTAGIASAFVGNNPIAPAEVPSLVSGIFSALSKPFEPEPTPPEPAVPVRSSIKADYIVDLIDGTK